MLPKLVDTLHTANPKLTAEEIADALWLARYMQNTEAQSPGDVQPTKPADTHIAELILTRRKSEQPSTLEPASSDLYLHTHRKRSKDSSQMGSLFRSPAASALPNTLGLGRALRPFKRRIPSRTAFVLNEEATAKRIAETDLWLPVCDPASSRWLDVALVVDEGASMVIWRQTIAELHLLLEREGAFRSVRTWGMVTDAVNGRARLYAGTAWGRPNRREGNPHELIDPSGQRLILVVTDCVSRSWDRGWEDGSVAHLLASWGRTNPVAVIQVLPQRLWMDTALDTVVPVLLHAPSPGSPNRRLISQAAHYWDVDEASNGSAVPIVTLEPESVLAWSRAIARAEDVWIPGYIFNTSITMSMEENINELSQEEQESLSISAQERVNRFRSVASPTAYKLAELLASVPVSLPVIRLIQQTMLPKSNQTHVAEVFLGGLLEEVPSEQDSIDPDYVEYNFIDGVRELLLASLAVGESLAALSNYIESHLGQVRDFSTLLANPLAREGTSIGKGAHRIASVAAKVLHGLGGDFAPLVDWLEGIANGQQQVPMDQLLERSQQVLDTTSETEQTKVMVSAVNEADKVPPEEQRQTVVYRSANVVVLGDSGVGKSGLSLVLTGQPFAATESTHGRHIWILDSSETELETGHREVHEIRLWDLAGQPGYRLTHQLYLNDVSVALVLFDAHNETAPFAGIAYWARALRQAQRIQGETALPMKTFLVAARIDRSGVGVSHGRIEALTQELDFDGYFETSAKDGRNIIELREAIKQAIDWEKLPKSVSTDLFGRIRVLLFDEKNTGRLLITLDDLYHVLLRTEQNPLQMDDLRTQFETCIGLMESQGLLRRLSFGNLLLLQPEVLDAYLSALVSAARDEPDGFGSISEWVVKEGNFFVPEEARIADRDMEKLLLIAMIEDLLRYEIALREHSDLDSFLIFPSESTRENPNLPEAEGKEVIFSFEGPVQNIYATLAVRLSHSGLFIRKDLWKNAITYTTKIGGTCGILLRHTDEGRAELTLFFDKATQETTRFHFEEYIRIHLQRRALPGTVQRRRIFVCSECGTPLADLAVRRRQERGFSWATCPVCDTTVSLLDGEEGLTATPYPLVSTMERAADIERDRSAAAAIIQGKRATNDFDVFLCHSGKDTLKVKEIGKNLMEQGILPWLDEWELPPGRHWQPLLEEKIRQIKSAAVFVGSDGIGPWQQTQLNAFLREFVRSGRPIIPVLLPDTSRVPKLPLFLAETIWVDFRKQDPDPVGQLVWGITGKRSQE